MNPSKYIRLKKLVFKFAYALLYNYSISTYRNRFLFQLRSVTTHVRFSLTTIQYLLFPIFVLSSHVPSTTVTTRSASHRIKSHQSFVRCTRYSFLPIYLFNSRIYQIPKSTRAFYYIKVGLTTLKSKIF